MSQGLWIAIGVIAVVVIAALVFGLLRYRRRQISLSPTGAVGARPLWRVHRVVGHHLQPGTTVAEPALEPVDRIDTSGLPAMGDDATLPRDAPNARSPMSHFPNPSPSVLAPPVAEPW